MTEDARELLREAAPQPQVEPDFEELWQRARRQRRTSRTAGAAGLIGLLAVLGIGLAQLVADGEPDLQIVDVPPEQPVPGSAQGFGEDETDAGVPYSAEVSVRDDVRFDGAEVCLSLRLGPAGEEPAGVTSSGRSCTSLDDHLERERVAWSHTQVEHVTAAVGWSPREVDHVIWELPDGERRFETTDAEHLPGSLFVAVLDRPLEEDGRLVLRDPAGGIVQSVNLEAPDPDLGERPLFELGEDAVWDSPADVAIEAAVEAFAEQALDLPNVAVEHDGTTDGPVWVTMTDTQGREFTARFSPDAETDAAWHVLRVGDGAGSLSFDPLELDLASVPDDVDHADLWIGQYGQTHMIELNPEDLATGTVDLREYGDVGPEDIAAALVVYRDVTGAAWEAHGGHFSTVPSND